MLCNVSDTPDNMVEARQFGGVEALVRLLTPQHNTNVHIHACWALKNLAVDRDNANLICAEGGIVALANLIDTSSDKLATQVMPTILYPLPKNAMNKSVLGKSPANASSASGCEEH